jgi:predicted extracellular nuclease
MNKRLLKMFSWITILALMMVALPAQSTLAVSPDVVISQVYGGGGNSGAVYTNDFIELFNRGTTTVSLAGWSLQYASATGTGNFGSSTTQITPLSGSLAPGQYFLVQEAQGSGGTTPLPAPDVTDTSPIAMSATGGKVALVTSATSLGCNGSSTPCTAAQLALIKDLVGWDGANFFEGSAPAPATSNTTAAFRNGNGCVDTDDNAADFTSDAPSPRNTASPLHSCSGPTNPTGTGAADPDMLKAGETSLLTVMVTPGANPTSSGLTVTCDLSAIGGSASQAFYDDGTNGDTAAGDNTFSYLATVDSNTSVGDKTLDCIITDAEARSGSASITVTVYVILPIGTVNGPVGDMDDGTAHRSPYAPPSGNGSGQTVVVQGVIYEKTLQATSFGGTYKGFYIQNTVATADGDPHTSDGLFVFMNTFSDLIGGYVPTVGDEVVISGKISEFFNMTEMSSASLIGPVVRSGVDIDAELPPVVVNPPDNLSDANRYWERLQGMRVQVPQNSIVLNGRNVFNPADAEVWVARSDSTIAQRSDPYTRRAFRDAHPLDDNYDKNNWDGNGYRILLGSLGIKATENNGDALIAPARTFDTVTNSPVGGLNYTFGKYRIEITEQPTLSEGPDPALNNPPAAFDRSYDFSIADYNLENLYDYRNNDFSGCDFTGDSGCSHVGTPYISDITPPFDYVPADDAAYQARLSDIANQIINDLHSPDILMVQEVENQDICSVSDGNLECGNPGNETDNADGKPDVLQELALKVASQGGPAYDAAFDRDSSDLRGIVPAFLYRTDRVELLSPVGDPVLGGNPAIAYAGAPVPYDSDVSNPKTLNAELPVGVAACETNWVFPRAPDIGLFRIYRTSIGVGSYGDVYVINNHFKSGPDSCVTHRTEQAKYNAALVAFIQAANPNARIVVGGDLNVYPRPDDPFAPIGQPSSSDQLGALYDPSLGLTNLWDVLLGQAPEAAYSYVYVGMAQTLDQMFVNPTMLGDLMQFRIAHINSDFPADYPGDVARGTSDHDPNVATFHVIFNWTGFFSPVANPPTLNTVKAGQAVPVKFSLNGDQGLNIFAAGYPQSTVIACDTSETQDAVDETVTAGSSSLSYDPITDTYNYVWKTDKEWAGTCRRLVVKLVDGTYHYTDFNFTK